MVTCLIDILPISTDSASSQRTLHSYDGVSSVKRSNVHPRLLHILTDLPFQMVVVVRSVERTGLRPGTTSVGSPRNTKQLSRFGPPFPVTEERDECNNDALEPPRRTSVIATQRDQVQQLPSIPLCVIDGLSSSAGEFRDRPTSPPYRLERLREDRPDEHGVGMPHGGAGGTRNSREVIKRG